MQLYKRSITLVCLFLALILQSHGQRAADGFFNVKDYGAKGDGLTLDTKAINKAIAACVKAGGGTVCIPAGNFVTGTFRLFSNINLFLSPGAVILASENTDDYLLQTDYGFSGSGAGGKKLGIIFADHAQNVSISGTGVIDGRAASFFYMDSVQVSGEEDSKYTRQGKAYMGAAAAHKEAPVMWKGEFANRPGTQLIFHACKKVTVRDITIRNANDWTFDINDCDDAKVLGISIDNDMRVPNSDGIDMYDSKNIIISDCDIRAGDDAIAVISTSNLKVTNCNLTSRSSGIRIGYNGFNDNNSGNLLFDNVRIYGANRGIGIFQRRKGNIENMLFSNMIIDTRLYPGEWWGHGEPIHISALPGLGFKEVGTISHVRFTNIIARGEEGLVLYGSEESKLQDISFDNVQLTVTKGPLTDNYAGNFDLRAVNDSRQGIFKHDIPAIYVRYVNGLNLRDIDVKWDEGLPDYFTNALTCDHFQGLSIDGFSGSMAPAAPANGSLIDLQDGSDVKIRSLRNTGRAAELVSHNNVSGLDLPTGEAIITADPASSSSAGQSEESGNPFAKAEAARSKDLSAKGFVQREGSSFILDGKPYYYIGTNYWQGPMLSNGTFGKAGKARVQRELSFLAAHGVTNLRIVAGAEGRDAINGSFRVGPSLQPEKGKFSEAALAGLDFLLLEMDKRHMKAVLYLSNNWDWSGGFLQYLNWNGRLPDSILQRKMSWSELQDHTSQFYTCSDCMQDYFRQVKQLVGRTNSLTHKAYIDDPAIMAWEMANEPRPMRPTANAAYKAWVKKTAALIREMDPHHLITIGTEGQASTADDLGLYRDIHNDRNIDYLTIHVWPKNWGYFSDTAIAASMDVIVRNTRAYIEKHIAVARTLGKPLVIEEFGLPRDRQSFDPHAPSIGRQEYYQLLFSILKNDILHNGVLAGCNFWAFGGEGRPIKGQVFWKKGDSFLGDPPMEEQGLNAVFDGDNSLWTTISSFSLHPPFN